MIYFDNAATTKPSSAAIEAALHVATECYGNASSLHKMGIQAERVILEAKKKLLEKLPSGGDIIFTSGATESINTAIFGVARAQRRRKTKCITTATEHAATQKAMEQLEAEGFTVVRITPCEIQGGDVEQAILDACDEDTALVSVLAVNNETGFLIDTVRLYRMIKARFPDIVMHTDGVQGYGKTPLQGDLITLSSHKIHGLKGIGGLYIKSKLRITPLIYGGSPQKDIRAGTLPTELIAAFGAAAEEIKLSPHITELNHTLVQQLREINGININRPDFGFHDRRYLSHILNFSVLGIKSEVFLHFLEEKDIYVSGGSACSKGKKSTVLKAFGISDEGVDSAIRVSFCEQNTMEEVIQFLKAIQEGIQVLKRK